MTTQASTDVRIFRGDDRGSTELDWLDSRHSFAFGRSGDPSRRRFSALRVLNDDVVAPSGGFAEHGHRDMEIITLVLDGALEHRDSAGNHEVLGPGDVQVMTAGSGILHSEHNASSTEPAHFLQIWITPDRKDHEPRHAMLPASERPAQGWSVIASGGRGSGGLPIHQDATVTHGRFENGDQISVAVPDGRRGYLHLATGSASWDSQLLEAGDALELESGAAVTLTASEATQVVFFELPG